MPNPLTKILNKIKRITQWAPKANKLDHLVTIGTSYGGWTIPDNFLTEQSICYLAGAGEDISFDVGLVEKFKCHVFTIDPTPRAKKHFEKLMSDVDNNTRTLSTNNNKKDYYNLSPENKEKLTFIELGLWDSKDELKFFSPQNPDHVSHSAVNLQNTQDYFLANVDRLSSIMKEQHHKEIDLLKIDIEGAEYNVLKSLIEDNITPKILCIEYDEMHSPIDKNYLVRVKQSIEDLIEYGYVLVFSDQSLNCTFVFKEHYLELTNNKLS